MAYERQDKKVFAGPRVRRLRRDKGLTQARMADELSISASYLNLIEIMRHEYLLFFYKKLRF